MRKLESCPAVYMEETSSQVMGSLVYIPQPLGELTILRFLELFSI